MSYILSKYRLKHCVFTMCFTSVSHRLSHQAIIFKNRSHIVSHRVSHCLPLSFTSVSHRLSHRIIIFKNRSHIASYRLSHRSHIDENRSRIASYRLSHRSHIDVNIAFGYRPNMEICIHAQGIFTSQWEPHLICFIIGYLI